MFVGSEEEERADTQTLSRGKRLFDANATLQSTHRVKKFTS